MSDTTVNDTAKQIAALAEISRRRLESEGWAGLVDRVVEAHGMTREEAIQAIIDFGG